jgi:quercetin dioxygenase-like cupin family protein
MHSHDREHVAVVIKGGCRIEADLELMEAGEGSVITIPSGVPHKFSNVNPERIVLLIMNFFKERDGAEPRADEI